MNNPTLECKITCNICNSVINKKEWNRHIKSKKHNKIPPIAISFIFEKTKISFN